MNPPSSVISMDFARQIEMIRRRLSELRLIDTLQAGHESVLSDASPRSLLTVIRRKLLTITRNLYVIRHIPEQYEDLYDILIDGAIVAHIEIPREPHYDEIVIETCSLHQYLKCHRNIGKSVRRRIEMALQLAREHSTCK